MCLILAEEHICNDSKKVIHCVLNGRKHFGLRKQDSFFLSHSRISKQDLQMPRAWRAKCSGLTLGMYLHKKKYRVGNKEGS